MDVLILLLSTGPGEPQGMGRLPRTGPGGFAGAEVPVAAASRASWQRGGSTLPPQARPRAGCK